MFLVLFVFDFIYVGHSFTLTLAFEREMNVVVSEQILTLAIFP